MKTSQRSSSLASTLNVLTDNRLMRFLNNRTVGGKIMLLIVPVVLLALVSLAGLLWNAYRQYDRSRTLKDANAVSDFIIHAASEQARERGFTATALSNPQDAVTRGKISASRTKGDASLDSALKIAEKLISKNPLAAAKYTTLVENRRKRDSMRNTADAILGNQVAAPTQISEWIAVQTSVILAERSLTNALFTAQNSLESILELNSQIKNSVLNASEFAGRERASIGTAIATGQPIPSER